MSIYALVPILVMVIGLLLWKIPTRFSDVGERMFTCGLLVSLFVFAWVGVHIGSR